MENIKLIKFLVPVFILGFFIANTNSVFAYSIDTHAYLTSEVFDFYNKNFSSNKIPDELKDYLIDGARREDDVPRWMNHFYDPIKDRGLSCDTAIDFLCLGNWQKSKDWSNDANNQNSAIYKVPTVINSILNAIQQKKLSLLTDETNFTWNEAIKYWLNGNKEKSMFALGHVLHLIEDASVPDHTRNDPHPNDSVYENFTAQFRLNNPDNNLRSRLNNKKPIISDNLTEHFNDLAKYSNNNFYTKDTIGIQSGYKLPQPDFTDFENIGRFYYFVNKDQEGQRYFLLRKNSLNSLIISSENDVNITDVLVKNSYWKLLSTKSVQYGAGVVNLFFQEVEKAKNDPNFVKTQDKSFFTKATETVGSVFSFVGNIFASAKDVLKNSFSDSGGFQQVGEVELGADESNKTNTSYKSDESNFFDRTNKTNATNRTDTATAAEIIITEIMYSPKGSDAGREWIEIFNNDDFKADLTGWKFFENGTNHNLRLVRGSNTLNAFGYAIITSDAGKFLTDYPNYQGALFESSFSLNNTGETIAIKSGDLEIDKIIYRAESGANGNGNSLQRIIGLTGQIGQVGNSTGQIGQEWQEAEPTPGKPNKISIANTGIGGNPASEENGEDKSNETNKTNTADTADKASAPTSCNFETTNSASRKIIINEIAWMGSKISASDEWIELKNISSAEIDLSNWQIMDKGNDIKINLSNLKNTKIKAGGLLLLERTDDNSVPNILADLIYSGAISNSDEGLKIFNSQCNLIDEAIANSKWPAGDNEAKRTMERNLNDFNWHSSSETGGTPKKENSTGIIYGSGGGTASNTNNNQQTTTNATNNTQPAPQFYDVAINEIMYDANGSDAGREWIEILNKSSSTIDLTNWKLNEGGTNHGLTLKQGNKNLSPNSYAIISSSSTKFLEDFPEISSSIFESAISLNNTGETIILKNQDLKIDEVAYSAEQGAGGNGKSLQLIIGPIGQIGEDWKESAPTPGEENRLVVENINATTTEDATTTDDITDNATTTDETSDNQDESLPEPEETNQAPTAVFLFSPQEPKVGETINFDASSSTDSDGEIISYEWDFGDENLATSSVATTSHTYATSGEYLITLAVFDDKNASSTATATISVLPEILQEQEDETPTTTPSENNKIKISEILFNPANGDEEKEFIELYNLGEQIDISNWSLKYRKENSTSTESIALIGGSEGDKAIIPKSGYFLIGLNSYNKSNYNDLEADVLRTKPLPNGSDKILIFLYDAEGSEVDFISYDSNSAQEGQGIERKAFENEVCVSAQDTGEYLGNGCDNNNADDFEIRNIPSPQNSQSLTEPREAPIEEPIEEPEDETEPVASQVDSSVRSSTNVSWRYVKNLGKLSGSISYLEIYGETDTPGKWQAGICVNPVYLYDWYQCGGGMAVVLADSNEEITSTSTKELVTFNFPETTLDENTNYGIFIKQPGDPVQMQSSALYGSLKDSIPDYGYVMSYNRDPNDYRLGYGVYNIGIQDIYFVLK